MIIKIGVISGSIQEKSSVEKIFEEINSLFDYNWTPVFLDIYDLNSAANQLIEKQIDCVIMDSDSQPELMIDKLDWFWMPYPDSQKTKISVIFNKDDERFLKMRLLFCKVVTFIGSGIGKSDMCSLAGLKALKNSEVCLHDSLIDYSILDNLPSDAKIIDVGKRCSHHKMSQTAINGLIAKYARMGFRVSRLKSGDPSIFGRLAEEVETLSSFHIPYRIIPGMSSLNAISANTGIVLTKRGVNRGFCVVSAIKHGGGVAPLNSKTEKLPMIFYMGVRVVGKISQSLIANGMAPSTKAMMVFGIGGENETVIKGNLENIKKRVDYFRKMNNLPGLLVVGNVSDYNPDKGILGGKKIVIVGNSIKSSEIAQEIKDFGGIPIKYKIDMQAKEVSREKLIGISRDDFIFLDEVEAANFLIKSFIKLNIDIRNIPPVISATQAVSDFLKSFGILPTIEINETDKNLLLHKIKNKKLSYIHSKDIYGHLAIFLKNNHIHLNDLTICENRKTDRGMPDFELALFLDIEYLQKFSIEQNLECLRNKGIVVGTIAGKNYLSRFSINSVVIKSNKKNTLINPAVASIIKLSSKSSSALRALKYSSA